MAIDQNASFLVDFQWFSRLFRPECMVFQFVFNGFSRMFMFFYQRPFGFARSFLPCELKGLQHQGKAG